MEKSSFWIAKIEQRTDSNKIIKHMTKIIRFHQESHFVILDYNFKVRTQEIPKTHILAVLSRTKPIFIPY